MILFWVHVVLYIPVFESCFIYSPHETVESIKALVLYLLEIGLLLCGIVLSF